MAGLALFFRYSLLFSFLKVSTSLDTINASQSLRDGDTLVLSSGSFELGFFSLVVSTSGYLGLWYKSPQTVLWVANREIPIFNKFGTLNITSQGILVLRSGTQNIVCSTNMSTMVQDPLAQVLESGNLSVREANDISPENFMWQSFDYPSDTLLPAMKLGSKLVAGLNRFLSSWRSTDDPSHGRFSLSIDLHGYRELPVKREARVPYRLGPWNGLYFTGFTGFMHNPIYTFEFVFRQEEVYNKYELQNSSVFSRLTLFPLGHEQQVTWSDQTIDWVVFSQPQADGCDNYALCGPNAHCDINNSLVRTCLGGFMPLSERDWNLSNWSGGSVRSTPLDCTYNDGFLRCMGIKLPDTSSSWFDKSISLKECKELCSKNCSCIAYTNLDIREGGSGCVLWFDCLIDLRKLTDGRHDLYVRMAASELGEAEKKRTITKKQAGITVSCFILVMGMLTSETIFWKRRINLRKNNVEDPEDDMELPIFDLTQNIRPHQRAHCQQRNSKMRSFELLFVFSFLSSILPTSTTLDIINPSQSMRDGQTLVSKGGSFELGFFSPANSKNRYLGLWYQKSPQPILWVANRENPLSNKLGALNITKQGIVILLNSINDPVWSSHSNVSRTAQNPVAQLLESGNLVVREENDNNPANFMWQSFDYPCDTLLPGMKLGINFVTGLERFLSSWKSSEDPARGEFSFLIDPHGYPQLLLKRGNRTLFRAGSWNGLQFTARASTPNPITANKFVFTKNEVYFEQLMASSVFSRLTLNPSGFQQRFTWNDRTHDWVLFNNGQIDECENYALCGPNTRCDMSTSPVCECLEGFMPKSLTNWNFSDWSDGCIRRTPMHCSDKDGFLKYTGNKLPDTFSSWFDKSIGLKECEGLCLRNCSCSAYANLDIRGGGSGCLIWFGGLIDIKKKAENGQDLYVRMAASELGVTVKKRNSSKMKKAGILATTISGVAMLILGIIFYIWRRNGRKNDNFEVRKEDMELPIFNLSTIAHATGNFSSCNKLGEGGFGPVYKGSLIGGKEVAVKRLSKSSGQGLNEFKNEVILIAKLQHRNLVKLLGCCIHGDEKMLIYEYMPNKSLDFFLFDQTRRKLLDWSKRINVIGGIARGLLYLHQDSRLRIIHRDIKASNILLDNELNPKISDFGLARMFGGDQTEANTNRVVGTYGYMSPEYASDGHFSVKSDVFSFGVLVLEIVSGKKNRGFRHVDQNLNLLGHAWMLWIKGTPLELIDECFTGLCNPTEVLRCINVALLCVQQRSEDRPNMSAVVLMLGSEIPLAQPKQPGFFMGQSPLEEESSANNRKVYSENEVSLTSLEAR